ncbi:MAG: hypothetical protein KGL52_03030 [Rhodospirillales bacterium]|nr:hypothetical protein [Rhodospirillales bacterium]
MPALLLPSSPAHAHAIAGARMFVNTVVIDDPGVGDEANLPLASVQSPDGKSTVTDANFEYDKTILPDLGIAAGTDYQWITVDPNDFGKTHGGFGDPYVQLKYRWIVLPRHEFMSSVQVKQAFGRAGTTGIDTGFDTTTVSAYFGKGLGDIPWDPIRPFAITGEIDYGIPNTGPSAGGGIATWSGGLSLQYSIPYLQSQIRNYDLPSLLARLTPVVELGWSSAAANTDRRPSGNPTTFLLGTGAVWTGETYAVAAEVLWPLNGAAGHGLGVIGQFHLYFDDMFPNTLGRPLISW